MIKKSRFKVRSQSEFKKLNFSFDCLIENYNARPAEVLVCCTKRSSYLNSSEFALYIKIEMIQSFHLL